MNISTSSSVPSNFKIAHRSPRSKSPPPPVDNISISSSAGNLRLSTAAGPHQRLRIPGASRDLPSRPPLIENEKSSNPSWGNFAVASNKKFQATVPDADCTTFHLLSRFGFWLHWLFVVYCCLSVVFLSATLVHRISDQRPAPHHDASALPRSFLSNLTNAQLLSIASPGIHPPPRAFHPFILRKTAPPGGSKDSVTACIWLRDGEFDIDSLLTWASRWSDSVAILKFHPLNTGPISLVVTSKAIPLTPHIHSVLHKLSSASVSVSIFVHLLHPDPTSRAESPNAYLNLARLFAPTTHVLLLPGNLSVPPPPLHSLPPSPRLSVITNTAINTTTANTEFPFHAPLALLTRADHPTWCTERAAAAHVAHDPRVLEWDLCVWQFWLGAFGDVGVVQAPAEKGAQGEEGRMGFAMRKLYQRASFKYRAETCILAGKRVLALGIAHEKSPHGISNAEWLRRACEKMESEK